MKPSDATSGNLRLAVGLAYAASFTAFLVWGAKLVAREHVACGLFGCSYLFLTIIVNTYRSFFGLPMISTKKTPGDRMRSSFRI